MPEWRLTERYSHTEEIISPFVADCMNTAIYDHTFPHELKIGEILLVFKNNEPTVEIILTSGEQNNSLHCREGSV